MLSHFPYLDVLYFSQIIWKSHNFQKSYWKNVFFLFWPQMYLETFFFPEGISDISSWIYTLVRLMYPLFLSQSKPPWNFFTIFGKNLDYQNFENPSILRPGVLYIFKDERTDGFTETNYPFKRISHFIRNWRNPQYLSRCHKIKTFTRHVLTFVWIQGAELENDVTVVVNC